MRKQCVPGVLSFAPPPERVGTRLACDMLVSGPVYECYIILFQKMSEANKETPFLLCHGNLAINERERERVCVCVCVRAQKNVCANNSYLKV